MSDEVKTTATATVPETTPKAKEKSAPKKSTSARLFPENVPAPTEEKKPEPAPQPKTEEKKPEAVKAEAPVAPASLEEILKEKGLDPKLARVKTKVDGIEAEVTVDDLIRAYQTDKHLSQKGQTIGEQRKALLEAERRLEEKLAQIARPAPQVAPEPEIDPSDPNFALLTRISKLESLLEQAVLPTVQETRFSKEREKLVERLREKGIDDAEKFSERVQNYLNSLEDPEAVKTILPFANDPVTAELLFKAIKFDEIYPEHKKLRNAPPAPIIEKEPKRAESPVVKIDGGAQSSSSLVDDYQAQHQQLFTAWVAEKPGPKKSALLRELFRLQGQTKS